MAQYMNVDSRTIRKKTYDRSFDPLYSLDDLALYKDYRFDNEGILFLTNLLKDDLLETDNCRGLPIKPHIAVMATLSYLGSNAFQLKIADTLGISQSSVSRSNKVVTTGLAKKVNEFVKFPVTDVARRSCQAGFFQLAGFPGVVSCIGGTHVKVLKPSQDEHQYVCRKGYHSLNVQVACDHTGKFTNVVAKWPGSTHDSFVLKQSDIWPSFETGQATGLVLGDSGYMCRPWLLTPYATPTSDLQKDFNLRQRKTRVVVECAIGRLKKTFNILHQEIRIELECVPNLIASCVILKNIILEQQIRERVMKKFHLSRLDIDLEDDNTCFIDPQPDTIPYEGSFGTGNAYRDAIATQFQARNPV